jgi:hypothetical protein
MAWVGRQEMHKHFVFGRFLEHDYFEDREVDGRLTVRGTPSFGKQSHGMEARWNWHCILHAVLWLALGDGTACWYRDELVALCLRDVVLAPDR